MHETGALNSFGHSIVLGFPTGPQVQSNFKFSSNSVKIPCNVVKDLIQQVNNVAPDVVREFIT